MPGASLHATLEGCVEGGCLVDGAIQHVIKGHCINALRSTVLLANNEEVRWLRILEHILRARGKQAAWRVWDEVFAAIDGMYPAR